MDYLIFKTVDFFDNEMLNVKFCIICKGILDGIVELGVKPIRLFYDGI
jgi:hypothetical protein